MAVVATCELVYSVIFGTFSIVEHQTDLETEAFVSHSDAIVLSCLLLTDKTVSEFEFLHV